MLSAYVLIQTEVGKAGQVAQAIRGIDGVQRPTLTERMPTAVSGATTTASRRGCD
jgi:hypothetical protein